MNKELDHEKTRRAIRAHFHRGNSREVEHGMFTHLRDCDTCRSVYEQYAALTALDPEAPSRSDRLLRGLGLAERRSFFSGWIPMATATAAAAAAALLLVLAPWDGSNGGVRARGGSVSQDGPELLIYRIVNGDSELVLDRIAASDRLALAYVNPRGAPFLMVFGRTADGEIYWYYPAWTSTADNPRAIEVSLSHEPEELHDAVRHSLPPGRMQLVAVFADRPWHVREVEAAIARTGEEDLPELPGAEIWSRSLLVEE